MNLLKNSTFILSALLIVGGLLRLYNINWDQGHLLHPDERLYLSSSNISLPESISEFLSPKSSLNPNMFYYGSFPLYLYKFINVTLFSSIDFMKVSRYISSIFSVLTIPLIFLMCKQFFSRKVSILATFIFTFSAGSIQHAHFNTTESILIFLLTLVSFLSILMLRHKTHYFALSLGILVGIAYATKIVGATFIIIPLTSFIIIFLKEKKILKVITLTIVFLISTITAGALFAPYQIVDFSRFSNEQTYMQGVTYGTHKPPFIIIYEYAIPYIYQLTQVFPFIFGFISLPLSLFGVYFIIKKIIKEKSTRHLYISLIIFPLLYFLWAGAWYAKFGRYYVLLFPFLSIWAAYSLSKLKNIYVILFILLIITNGTLFMKVYLKENTRIQASKWIYANIPNQSKIMAEHWDDNLPLPLGENSNRKYTTIQLAVYDNDSQEKVSKLSQDLSQSDYFIISSRRVYYSILINKNKYPLTSHFYELLFDEKLGYKLEKKFTNYPFYFSDDFADESFQSYDHPPVYIFRNDLRYSSAYVQNLIENRQ